MLQMKKLYDKIMREGELRSTRTGDTLSIWNQTMEFDLADGFPAVTSKTLQWNAVVGELLWFLSGSSSLKDLRRYTYGSDEPRWTIWNDDAARWQNTHGIKDKEFVGDLYPTQFRNIGPWDRKLDQIGNLIKQLTEDTNRRDHIVMAWNPVDIRDDTMALKPCHLGFQCFVRKGEYLDLHWWQRSVDSFLGLPFNIASYALLTHLLAAWTGLKPGRLSCWLGDTHLYMNHSEAVTEYMQNPEFASPTFVLPRGCETLASTLELDARDFVGALDGYNSAGVIKAPLSVGA
jgi:thymidylate synthase